MAIDEADQSDAGQFSEGEASEPGSEGERSHDATADSDPGARVGEYTWEDFMEEYGHGDEVSALYSDDSGTAGADDQLGLDTDESVGPTVPTGDDWTRVEFDPESYLGYHPDELRDECLSVAGTHADVLENVFLEYVDPETTPVVKDVWTWEHYKWEYYYDENGDRPRDENGEVVPHDKEDALGFDPDTLEDRLSIADDIAMELDDVVEERTVNVQEDLDEDEFFSTADGNTTVTNRYDLEKAVPLEKKSHFQEMERYWVNKPYACVVIFHSEKENEKKYYMIEPYLNEIELELQEFLSGKLRTAIKYSDEGIKEKANEDGRRTVIEDETRRLLKRYDLFEKTSGSTSAGLLETVRTLFDDSDGEQDEPGQRQLEGIEVRPEPIILDEDPDTLSEYQVEKLLYLLKRNFIGYERIDGIKHDINVEDISCDGYNSPVFVYHSDYEQIITNIYHGEDELDDFVVKLAQRSGKGISKRLPQVDATLPDGSRAQLTLGQEVSDHGTNYTIRQFKDVPFTPIDLINWNTFSLDEMAFLWLCIENHKSLIFAGGTASGKTTSLNAVSLFIPSSAKIVSIEDTREVELPQRNWIASVTRPSFSDDEQGDVDEFDLLEAALRQRPDYIVMGEIRGEEGRTLFQVMSTGHTTYTTFHADSVDEVLKRFTTDPINVSKTMFTALDLVSIQTQTRVQGRKVRRNKSLTEINHYEAEHDEINVQDVYQWQAETDEFLKMGDSNTLEEIQFDRGWSKEKLEEELFKREVILAYLIKNGLNTYAEVAATVQAFINDPDTILTLIANGQLEESLEDLREMESVLIDVDQEKEELVPRPEATSETYNLSMDILERAEESLFEEYRGKTPSGLASALGGVEQEDPIEVEGDDDESFDFANDLDEGIDDEWELGGDTQTFTTGDTDSDEPAWLSDDSGFDIGSGIDGPEPSGTEAMAGADGSSAELVAGDGTETEAEAGSADFDSAGPDSSEMSESAPEIGAGAGSAGGESDGPMASSPADASEPADAGSGDDPKVFPSDDPEEAEFGGLFDDMGETLDEIEADDENAETSEEPPETGSDRPGMDDAFPDDELDAVFDPDPMPESSDDEVADEDESTASSATDESTPASEDGDESSANAVSGSEPSATEIDATAGESADVTERTREPPTIDVGHDPATDKSDASGTTDTETSEDDAFSDDAQTADSPDDGPPVTDDVAESETDTDESDDTSIFGDASEQVFSDDSETTSQESGVTDDSTGESERNEGTTDDSIFESDDDGTGLFEDTSDEDTDA
ncbi:ATPase, T2SS/T4P/T4SS family [Halopiger djelfimassiliensis]|uniref:ATPase, T2SS/T4P/T4SS family n=1 Tax=Halopiger djelfimassiliensis TaxID=1293047 RepID=UPI0006782171|nr:ATPase, T2SS/T4P/T4SS family [Halopiger djelfimassiliensis]